MASNGRDRIRVGIAVVVLMTLAAGALLLLLAPRPPSVPEPGAVPEGPASDRDAAGPGPAVKRVRPSVERAEDDPTPPAALAGAGTGRIVGRAVDRETGHAVPGARATTSLVAAEGGRRRRSAPQDAAGTFAVRSLPAGSYTVSVYAPRYLPRVVRGVAVRPGEEQDIGDVALDPGSFLRGQVVDAEDSRPVAGAVLREDREDRAGPHPSAPRSVSDERGVFELGPLSGGRTAIRVTRPGYEVVRLRDVLAPAGGTHDLGPVALRPRPHVAVAEDLGPAAPGLGIAPKDGGYVVRIVAPGSSAAAAQVPAGARIVAISGYPAEDLAPDQALSLLHGTPGTRVTIDLSWPDWPQPRSFALERR